jgi:hypothetical protein
MHIGGRAARGDADEEIVRRERDRVEIVCAPFRTVLGPFLRAQQRRRTAGDQADDESEIGAEGRRNLAGIEHAEATRGTGPRVDNATTAPQRPLGGGDGSR